MTVPQRTGVWRTLEEFGLENAQRSPSNTAGVARILKLARTIADLANAESIETVHLAGTIQHRPRRQV
jgi:predicted ATPase with chaperone activity